MAIMIITIITVQKSLLKEVMIPILPITINFPWFISRKKQAAWCCRWLWRWFRASCCHPFWGNGTGFCQGKPLLPERNPGHRLNPERRPYLKFQSLSGETKERVNCAFF